MKKPSIDYSILGFFVFWYFLFNVFYSSGHIAIKLLHRFLRAYLNEYKEV